MAKNDSRLKKISYNVVLLALYQMTVFICNLILPRFILKAFGSEYNGIISSITQFLNFISILRLGVAGATRVELYKSLAHDDFRQTSAIVRATEIFMRKIAGIFVIYILLMSFFYPMLVDSSYSFFEIASLIIVIGLGTFAQYFFGITYSTLLQADQKLYIYNVIQIIATIVNTIAACILIKLGFSIQIVKLGSSVVFSISPILLNVYVTKHYHLDKYVQPDNTALKRRGEVVAHSIANIVHDNTDVVVLTLFAGVKVVSVYSVYNLIMNGLKQLMSIFISGLESAFGDMWVKKEINKMYSSLELYEYLMYSFVSVVFSCASILIIPFVKIYTSGITDINYIVPAYAFLAVIAQAFYCIRMPYLTIVQAAGHYKETRNGALAEAFINIIVSVCLTIKIGLLGVVIGTLVANAFRTIQYAVYLSKHILPRSMMRVINRLLWTIGNFYISTILCKMIIFLCGVEITQWSIWILFGVISVSICGVVTLISSYIFYRKDVVSSLQIMKRVLRKGGCQGD